MKNLLLILVLSMAFMACQKPKQEEKAEIKTPTLTLKWETDTVLTTCESVIYDSANQVLYVANINGQPTDKDGNGFIAKLGLDGKIVQAQWVTGMDAPKGMGIYNGKLFVSDINRIHEIDIATGAIANTIVVDSAQFLNDITIDANGKVYVSDSNVGNILVLENGVVSEYVSGVAGVNGLLSEGTDLQMVSFATGVFNTIDAGKQITLKTDSIDAGDGIEALSEGGYLVSSWTGKVTYVSPEWKNSLLLDTSAESINAADIEYIAEKRLLLVPTFFKNKVVAYEVSK
ncbi:MAG: ATP/GTP-binding protein [Cytophagia bacterium]|nr:ATP/GTP-binding protein [Cytophagia bacterium]